MRKQVLEQLVNQFKIDPKVWKIVLYHHEGHYHLHTAFRELHLDRVENFSSDLVNRKTGEKNSCWIDFVTDCQGNKETYEACSHTSPSGCGIKFYVSLFNGKSYDYDGTPVRFSHNTFKV